MKGKSILKYKTMKLRILYAFLLFSSTLFSQQCIVKINLHLCLNCYSNYDIIDSLSNIYETSILLKGNMSEKKAKYVLSKKIPIIKLNHKLIISDSLYNVYNTCFESEIYIINKTNDVIFSTTLPNICNRNYNLLNLFNKNSDERIKLFTMPDNIFLSEASRLEKVNDLLYIEDIFFNQFHIINTLDNNIYTFNPDSIDIKPYFNTCYDDTMPYHLYTKFNNFLDISNNNTLKINNIHVSKQKAFVFLSIPYLEMKNEQRIVVSSKLALKAFVNGKEDKLYIIDTLGNENYYMSSCFFYHQNDFYFKITSVEKKSNDLLFLAKFSLQDSIIVFKEILNIKLPNFYVEEELYYNLLKILPSYPYCFFSQTTNYYNILTNELFSLPIKQKNFDFDLDNVKLKSSDFYLSDIYRDGDLLALINYNRNEGQYYYEYIDISNNKRIMEPLKLNFKKYSSLLSYGFIDLNTLYFITNDAIYLEKISILME